MVYWETSDTGPDEHPVGVDYAGIWAVATSSAGYVFAGYAHGTDNLWITPTDFSGKVTSSDPKGTQINLGGSEGLYGVATVGIGHERLGALRRPLDRPPELA